MKKKIFDFSVLAVSIIIIGILFSACSISKNIDPNVNTTDPESISSENSTKDDSVANENFTSTNTSGIQFTVDDCFIASDDPYVIEYYESYDCTPGYVYFEKRVFGEIRPLFEKYLKITDIAELVNKIYVVTDDNEVVKVNKEDGSYETVYKPLHGSIDDLAYISEESKYVYFNDGAYIIKLNPSNEEYNIVTRSDYDIFRIYGGGGDFDKSGDFYCEDCNEEYVVWEDMDYNFYWYHPETEKIEKVYWEDLYFGHPNTD